MSHSGFVGDISKKKQQRKKSVFVFYSILLKPAAERLVFLYSPEDNSFRNIIELSEKFEKLIRTASLMRNFRTISQKWEKMQDLSDK